MSDRYIWAGEIIDAGDGDVNLDDEEIIGRLNELDHENTKLNADLTETIAAVSDLMDENSDLRRKLAEAYDFHPRAMKLIEKRKPFLVIANDEPYFVRAYSMIRFHELRKGRWTDEDQIQFDALCELWASTEKEPTDE